MAARGRVWRVGKWAGVIVCLLLVGLFFVSRRLEVRYTNYAQGFWLCLVPGAVSYAWQPPMAADSYWRFDECDPEIEADWWPSAARRNSHGHVMVPIWMFFVMFAIPTGVLWYGDRRGGSIGRCKRCGYDLTMNVSGQCPECGVRIVRPPDGGAQGMASRD